MTLAAVIERSIRDPESWRYTDVEKILSTSFPRKREAIARDSAHVTSLTAGVREEPHARIVFVNGIFQPDRSQLDRLPEGVVEASAPDEYNLTLEGQTCLITTPVELLFVTTPDAPAEITTKLHISLGASGRLSLLERHEAAVAVATASAGEQKLSGAKASGAEQSRQNMVHIIETSIDLAKQAKLVHGKLVSAPAHMAFTNIHIAEGGFYDSFNLIKGGRLTRNETEACLKGPLAQCALNGLMLLSNDDHADTVLRVIHDAAHGTSRQFYKTIAGGKARGVFQGRIIVEKGADKTDGQQLSRAMLLSDQAEVDAKPELQINADDVKCSHGCAIGNIDAEALFYLRSRGLDENEARALLIRAFASEALAEIQIPEWREMFEAELEGWCDEQD